MSRLNRILAPLERLAEVQTKFNPFISIRDITAVDHTLSQQLQLNGPLSGTLASIKDNIVTKDDKTTCGSKILENYVSPFESTVTDLLTKAGTTILGKTNMDEFGMGSGTTFSINGPALNPLYENEPHICGGSSGGSAAVVASGLSDFALGTDTGGSIRLPAAYCGVIGFKPSYGRISRWGVIAYAQSLDTVGILSKDLSILEKVYNVLDQYDDKDPTSLSNEIRESIKSKQTSSEKLTIGIPEEYNLEELSPSVKSTWIEALTKLISQGHIIKPISLPSVKDTLPVYYTLAPAEASSNLSRYDGIRYGYRGEKDSDSNGTLFSQTRSEGFGVEVQRRILSGTYNLSSDAYKNHFLKASGIRSKLMSEFDQVFNFPNLLKNPSTSVKDEGIDIILAPSATSAAPSLHDFENKNKDNFLASYVDDTLTVPSSLAGIPAISIPWKLDSEPIPGSLQIIGQFGDDSKVLNAAKLIMNLNK